MDVFFHGASVTQQGMETSYIYQLKQAIKHEGMDIAVKSRGYGGTFLNNAGILTIDADVAEDNDICFVEWNTTGQSAYSVITEADLRHITGVLATKDIEPVFLIFGRRETIASDRENERVVKQFCSDHRLKLLDCRESLDPDVHLRDEVHTNESGAKFYADILIRFLQGFEFRGVDDLAVLMSNDIKNISALRGIDVRISELSTLLVEVDSQADNASLVLEIIKGPESPFIETEFSERVCVWDVWCHFNRPSFLTLPNRSQQLLSTSPVAVKVLPDAIDYSQCRREFFYDGVKSLHLKGIFGVNCRISGYQIKSIEAHSFEAASVSG